MKKKITSLLLAVVMILACIPSSVLIAYATEVYTKPTIYVESKYSADNTSVDVTLSIANNPGVAGAKIKIAYDSRLTLVTAKSGDAFSELDYTEPALINPCYLNWDSLDQVASNDGVVATITFQVADGVEAGEKLEIACSYEYGDIYDTNLQDLEFDVVRGYITIIDYIPGDANGDGVVNGKDVTLIRRYNAGYSVEINQSAANVNGDDVINGKDATLIRRYNAGYDVELLSAPVKETHIMTPISYKAATCQETGNIAYWHCSDCGKDFLDAAGNSEAAQSDIVIDKTDHTVVTDQAVAPTSTSTGLTEGSHCSVCGTVIIEQEEVAKLEVNEYSVTYYVANGDSYLEKQTITNSNPTSITDTTDCTLKSLSVPGYTFLGWFDGAGDNADQVKRINAGTSEDVELFAHWKKITYTVQYKSSLYPIESASYTVDTGLVLPTPKLSNYVFTGWSDEDGNAYDSTMIPVGSTGNIVLTANWTSERNKTWTKTKLDDPVIYEDEENNVILFAYEIGQIQNVPLYTIKDFGYISEGGITKTESTTYTVTISESTMQSYAQTVANATTESSNWSLSSDWSESTSVNEQWCKENGYTEEEANTVAKSSTDTWNISSGTSGSTSTTVVDSNQNDSKSEAKIGNTTTDASKTSDYTKYSTSETATVDNKIDVGMSVTASVENTATVSGKYSVAGAEASASDSLKTGVSTTLSADLSTEASDSSTVENENGSQNDSEHSDVKETESTSSSGVTTLSSNSATSTSSWNSSQSYGGSNTSSTSKTTSVALSEKISETYGYGSSYTNGGSSSNTQGLASTSSSSDEYASSVTYSKVEGNTVTSTWTTQSTKAGYHRWVVAGTAHVFAVVGYDMSTESYFVYTYSVMDDETHEFEDYSYTSSSFNDNENGVIPFEIPYYVCEYVANRVSATDGLKVDMDTGTITGYTGDYSCVVIPEYMNVGNGDVVKITGLSENAFKGNTNIKAVVLSDYITEIPASAFEGCSSLIGIGANSITKVGENAFSGCSSFVEAAIPSGVTELGTSAFDGVGKLTVHAANADVAMSTASSGADQIVLTLDSLSGGAESLNDSTLEVPSGTAYFELNGNGGTFNNLIVVSDADKTVINKANFISTSGAPLQLSSPEVILNQVTVKSTGIAAIMSAENTKLGLQGNITLTSSSANTMLCRSLNLYESNASVVGKLTVSGKMLVCGEIEGSNLLSYGDIEYIDYETFDKMMHSYTLYFDANGGSCDTESVDVPNGTAIGILPTPTRENWGFAGWYTEAVGGTQVTEETIFSSLDDITIYAHWNANQYTVSWNTGKGYTITVNRIDSPNAGAAIGTLSSGDAVYYGDVLSISYAADTGYNLGSCGSTSITVTGDVTATEIYTSASAIAYTASWSTGTGYSITVKRTSSPNAGASTGTLTSGATVYYGDVLSISYSASTGYTLGSTGNTSITVTGKVTSSDIYASATANKYTYNIVYKSSNGTSLGTSTATYAYGTTNTISAPSKSGYTTPSSQSVKWDSTSAKTITFTYSPSSVSSSQSMSSGTWYIWDNKYGITYSATAEYQNRTSTSVQIRIKWTNTLTAYTYYGYAQYFTGSIGGTSTGQVTIASSSLWASQTSSSRSSTVYSDWITVSASATQTSVSVSATYKDLNSKSGSWSNTMTIPTY